MEWTVTIEEPDEFGEIQRAQVQIEKGFERLASGEIGLSIDDGKRIMSALQEFVGVKEELATYALARRRAAKSLGFYAALSKGGVG